MIKTCYYLNMQKNNFPELLLQHFLNWQAKQGKRANLNKFASYLGYSRPTISMWLNGTRSPGLDAVENLANYIGPEIYDVFDLPRPDPDLQTLSLLWPHLSEETRHAIREQAEKYVTENEHPPVQSRAMEETA